MGREREEDAKPGDLPDQNQVSILRGLRIGTASACGCALLAWLPLTMDGLHHPFHAHVVRSILGKRVLFIWDSYQKEEFFNEAVYENRVPKMPVDQIRSAAFRQEGGNH
jgi:hypothetical protein